MLFQFVLLFFEIENMILQNEKKFRKKRRLCDIETPHTVTTPLTFITIKVFRTHCIRRKIKQLKKYA